MKKPLRILIVDDEAPARMRLQNLLGDILEQQPNILAATAQNGLEALSIAAAGNIDAILTDISMPIMDGVELARHANRLPHPPAIIFITAYDKYAIEAFDIAAVDYLLKPIRAERLAAALEKVRYQHPFPDHTLVSLSPAGRQYFSVNERDRILLVPIKDVLYLRAELKYLTLRTSEREYILNESLIQIEQEFPNHFLRIHRNCLVAYSAIAGVEKTPGTQSDNSWEILLTYLDERLPISRRQWPTVRNALNL